jgi:murein DD-endopeptidase MepM/ murein hydrolase activator NlpD
LCGAALMGGAVFAALDGVTNFAAVPETVETALRGAVGSPGEKSRKSDKLPTASESSAARNLIRISTTNRVGDREMVRVRPFVRIAANLSLTTSELSANIPPFNPQRLLAQSTGDAVSADTPGFEPDAEVSFVTRDLVGMLPRIKVNATVPIDLVIARVRDSANFGGAGPVRYASATPGDGKLAYATEGTADPYVGFEARVVPENITLLPKTAAQITGGNAGNERTITLKKGETVTTVLRDLGATPEEIKAIIAILGPRGRDGAMKEGQKLRVLMSPMGLAQRMQPVRVIVVGENTVEAVVALSDLGRWVSVDVQSAETQVAETDEEEEDDGSGVRLYQSIYETALRNNIPRPVIEELIRVYSYDVDFQRKVQPGDSFEVLYADDDPSNPADNKANDVQFAALTVGGELKRFYRFQTTDDGVVDYYDETGKSAKKFLVRKPVATGIMRSGFGARKHPILAYTKMHTGVDWAAPMGTPIYASGNGVVEKAGWEGGYGKYIRLKHNNGYETAYGHMTAFARGMEPGARVRQGQVIGFVGSTGLSTGAHVHYEILVNGRFVDPMRIRLPRGRVLENAVLANFERERDRIDKIIVKAPARVATAPAGGSGR